MKAEEFFDKYFEIIDFNPEKYETTFSKEMVIEFAEKYAEHQMKEYAEFCIECDRAGLPILEPNDYINKLK